MIFLKFQAAFQIFSSKINNLHLAYKWTIIDCFISLTWNKTLIKYKIAFNVN